MTSTKKIRQRPKQTREPTDKQTDREIGQQRVAQYNQQYPEDAPHGVAQQSPQLEGNIRKHYFSYRHYSLLGMVAWWREACPRNFFYRPPKGDTIADRGRWAF